MQEFSEAGLKVVKSVTEAVNMRKNLEENIKGKVLLEKEMSEMLDGDILVKGG